MEQPVVGQALEFGLAVLLGLGFGLAYDLCRGIRRLWPGLTWAMDVLFGLIWILGLLGFLLYGGRGRFRLYALAGISLGLWLWLRTAGILLLRLWTGFLQTIARIVSAILQPFVKFSKLLRDFAKKFFSSVRKWGTMIGNMSRLLIRPRRKEGGNGDALQEILIFDETVDSDSGGVCYRYPGFAAKSGKCEESPGGDPLRQH